MKTSRSAKVTKIAINHIEPNPHNPRRLFDEEPMTILQESIEKLGILVPITVYPKINDSEDPIHDKFVILDGERRWRCSIALKHNKIPGHNKIPAIIVERPSDAENILVMFHIHNLREGWQLMPTALKLEVLMKQLNERNERKLHILTKLSIGQIRRCKILLTYPKKFQNLMLAPPSERLKADFFIELERIRRPALKERFPPWVKRGDTKCIEILLDKYLNNKITAVTEFRKLAEIYRGSIRLKKKKQFYDELNRFLNDKDADIDSINVPGANFEKETKKTNKSIHQLERQLKNLSTEALASNENLVVSLNRLLKLIKDSLENAMVMGREGGRQ